jgi:hypothetical protein
MYLSPTQCILLRGWADLLVQAQTAVWTLAETLDLLKRYGSNPLKPGALRPSHDGPISEGSETRRAARTTNEAKQVRAKEEHEQQARNSQRRNENTADWRKQVNRGDDADGITTAQKPVPSLVLRISKVFAHCHRRRFYDHRTARASTYLTEIAAPTPYASVLPLSPAIVIGFGHLLIETYATIRAGIIEVIACDEPTVAAWACRRALYRRDDYAHRQDSYHESASAEYTY